MTFDLWPTYPEIELRLYFDTMYLHIKFHQTPSNITKVIKRKPDLLLFLHIWPTYSEIELRLYSLVSNRHKPKFFRILLFFHILKAYVRIYQLAKFRVLILINLWIIADSNSFQIVLSPLEKLRSVLNPAPRACAQGVSDSCSHRRAYKRNTLNAVSYSHKPK